MHLRRTNYRLSHESLEDRIVLTGTSFSGVETNHLIHTYSTPSESMQVQFDIEGGTSQGGTSSNAAPASTGKFEASSDGSGGYTIALDAVFEDADSDPLSFQINSGGSSSVFDSIGIQPDGTLQFILDGGVTGVVELVVEASDPGGGSAVSTLKVGVTELSPDPIIKEFVVYYDEDEEAFVVEGNVDNPDGDSSGYDVTLGGLGEGVSATTDSNGNFGTTLNLPANTTGIVTAQVTDPDGNVSAIVLFEIE